MLKVSQHEAPPSFSTSVPLKDGQHLLSIIWKTDKHGKRCNQWSIIFKRQLEGGLSGLQQPVIAGKTALIGFFTGANWLLQDPQRTCYKPPPVPHSTRRPAKLNPRMPSTAVTVCCILLYGTSEGVWVAWHHLNVRPSSSVAFWKWKLPPLSAALQALKQHCIGACQPPDSLPWLKAWSISGFALSQLETGLAI